MKTPCANTLMALLLCAVSVAAVSNSLVVLLVGGGMNMGTVAPVILGVAAGVWAWALWNDWPAAVAARWRWFRVCAGAVVGAGFASFLAVMLLIWSAVPKEASPAADWLIVLGAGLRGENMSKTLACRMDTAVRWLEDHPDARVIVSGGRGPGESRTEASAMAEHLLGAGIAPERVILEEKASSTAENIRYSRAILERGAGAPPWRAAVLTSNFHLFRTGLLARRQGLEMVPVPAPTPWYLLPNACLREYMAVVKSVLLDR